MHLSLYRKFRPDSFEKIVRQEHVVRILKNQIESGAVGHAYLLCGPRGTGKTSVARIFARAVNCEQPKNGSPCGVCPTCRALNAGSLDLIEIDAASNNGVNEMRDLREKVQYPPVSGRYKTYIIDEVHMLTDSAFNALLKTLEEPPAHAIFILATTEPHKIPATILSRCMRLDFKLIPEEDLKQHLISILEEIKKPYEPEAVSAIARAGAGSDRDMLSIAEMCISYDDKLTYEGVTAVLGAADFMETSSICESLLLSDLSGMLERVEQILSEGKAVGVLCRDILETLHEISVVKTCRTAEKLLSLPKKNFERIAEIAQKVDGAAILRASEILAEAEVQLRYVVSPRICLETALMKAATPAADASVEALMVRISQLEKRLDGNLIKAAPLTQTQAFREEGEAIDIFKEPIEREERISEKNTIKREERVSEELPKRNEPVIESEREERIYFPEPLEKKTEKMENVARERPRAELIYGKFIRLLRKTSKNGVLFTMCSDLEAVYEGEKLILYTSSETVHRFLNREEHNKVIKEVFSQLEIGEFEIRYKTMDTPNEKDALEELKKNFRDYPIEFKE